MKQRSNQILMVSPHYFGSNPDTAASNSFQHALPEEHLEEVRTKAVAEWKAFIAILQKHEIEVITFEDVPEPHTPDAVFPNNWISFHQSGKIVIYPMYAPNRRNELREDIWQHFEQVYGHRVWNMAEELEGQGLHLEGTGSLVLDRTHKVAYACTSARTTPKAFDIWVQRMGYEGVLFQAVDEKGQEVYHTNVMMAIGSSFAVVCLDSIIDHASRNRVIQQLQASNLTVIAITLAQMTAFAGNMLEVENKHGEKFLVMSQRAHQSLTPTQLDLLKKHATLLVIPIDVLETYSGGSVRCMMAEVFH